MAMTFKGPVPVPKPQTSPLTIIVTGAGRGIGHELVLQYAKAHKDNVVFAAVRDSKTKAVQALSAYPNVHIVHLDVSDEASIRASVKEVERVTQHVDVLVNNAAVVGDADSADPCKVSGAAFNALMNTNVTGVLLTTQAYLPLLRKSSAAKVINVSSVLGSNAHANDFGRVFVAYGLSKAALNYLTTAFRHSEPQIAFLAIHPGWVQTDMGSAAGSPPTLTTDSVSAIRYYIAEKGLSHSGDFLDTMTGDIIPF